MRPSFAAWSTVSFLESIVSTIVRLAVDSFDRVTPRVQLATQCSLAIEVVDSWGPAVFEVPTNIKSLKFQVPSSRYGTSHW